MSSGELPSSNCKQTSFPLHSIVLIVLISTNTLASLVCYAGKIRHTRRLCTASPKHDGSVSPCGPKAPCHLSGGTICKSLFSQQGFCCLPSKYSALPRIRRHLENALNLALSARQSPMKDWALGVTALRYRTQRWEQCHQTEKKTRNRDVGMSSFCALLFCFCILPLVSHKNSWYFVGIGKIQKKNVWKHVSDQSCNNPWSASRAVPYRAVAALLSKLSTPDLPLGWYDPRHPWHSCPLTPRV